MILQKKKYIFIQTISEGINIENGYLLTHLSIQ